MRPSRTARLWAGAALCAVAVAGCKAKPTAPAPVPSRAPSASAAAPEPTKPVTPRVKNVLLITIDALRADMPWTGYPRPIAPNLTRLAERSVIYTHAYALSSYTSMSLAGVMTGRYPSELVRDGRATSSFGPENVMLAEVLAQAGVRTLAAHGHVYFKGDTGIAQGFDDWRVVDKITSRPARDGHVVDHELAELAMAALDDHAKDHGAQRFFAWVHFMDPHFSYARHEGFPRFSGSPYETDGGARTPVAPGVPLSSVGQSLKNQYDAEVVFTDHQVGRLLDHVGKHFAKDTAVIVSADHGEAFGEHKSYFEHGFLLYEVTTRVPLLVHVPGVAPRRIDARRSHVDLARTILDLMQVPAADSMRGESLVPELTGAPATPRPILIDMPYTDQTPRRRAVIDGDRKIVVTETEEVPELYDLSADPGEQQNLAAQNPELLERMQRRYRELDRALPDFEAPRRWKRQY